MSDLYAGPRELAALVASRWREEDADSALPRGAVEALLTQCYLASLTHEEARPTTFRLALGEPAAIRFDEEAREPFRVRFERSLPLDPHELKRLAPAASFHRALLGVHLVGGSFEIWGLVHSGPRWAQSARGGATQQSLPEVVIVAVTGPGRILVSHGANVLGELTGGVLNRLRMDIFSSRWLLEAFSGGSPVAPAALSPGFASQLALHALRRMVATIRATRHGGTLVFTSPSAAATLVSMKYALLDEPPRRRLRALIHRVVVEALGGHAGAVSWAEYEARPSRVLDELDEALFETAHFVASMSGVDGAVVLTHGFDLLGFGGEISGELQEVGAVSRALDLEGDRCEIVRADRVGTRHRSAYRLCAEEPGALAVVVSQDGGVRFIRQHQGVVTFWNQIATGPWEV